MASTYVNDLRLNEMATGDASGTWGTNTNVNLELIGEALGYGTEGITTNADTHTSTIADGATDPVRAMYVEYTGTLDSACTITIAPNTINRMQFIENGTSGSQNIIISQGSGANITIPPGDVKAVYLDGAGSGAAVVDAFASLNVVDLKVQDDLTVTGDIDLEGSIDVNGTANLDIVDIDGAVDMATTLAVAGNVDFNGDLDVDGTTNLDNTDIDGTLDVSGQATFADGSAGAPSISNTGDVNAGLFFSAADVMSFSAGGTAQFTMADGSISPVTDNDIDLGTASLKYKSFFAGLVDTENFKVNGGQGDDGQVLTSTGSGVAWEAASGGATDINGLSDAKTFGTSSIMLGDATTGTIDGANYNTGVGVDVFAALTSGDYNSVLGFQAGYALTTGEENTAVGNLTGQSLTTGSYNTAVGSNSLTNTTTANFNTTLGRSAMHHNTTGSENTAVGSFALHRNTTAANNTAVGYNALEANTTGTGNTSVGTIALDAITTSSDNTAVGHESLTNATSGAGNTALGKGTMTAVVTGSNNVAVGRYALSANTDASNNVAVGINALVTNSTGANNTAVGGEALAANTTAASNTGFGFQAGTSVTTGTGTTAVGSEAGEAITTGNFNSCLGIVAGSTITTGDKNLCLGYDSGTSSSPNHITTGDNAIVLGNNTTASAHIKVDWTVTSDKRDKTDIEPLTMGLNFVNKLEPVTYRWDMRSDYSKDFSITPDGTHKQQKLLGGLLAQDVEKVEREYGYKVEDKTSILTDKHDTNGNYGLTYSKFIPVLINAVQELSMQVDKLKSELLALKGE